MRMMIVRGLKLSRFYSKQVGNYTISRVTSVYPKLLDGLNKLVDVYFRTNPVAVGFRITENRDISPAFRRYFMESISQGFSFVATDNDTGDVIGMQTSHYDTPRISRMNDLATQLEDEREREMVKFWLSFYYEPKRLSCGCGLYTEFTIVDPAYQKSGVARSLAESTQKMNLNLPDTNYFRTEATSEYMAKIIKTMGYQQVYEKPFAEVLNSKGEPAFAKIEEPHTNIYVFIRENEP